jgi:hypothetical protein
VWVDRREEANKVSVGSSALQGSVGIRPISEKQDEAEEFFLSLVCFSFPWRYIVLRFISLKVA